MYNILEIKTLYYLEIRHPTGRIWESVLNRIEFWKKLSKGKGENKENGDY